jgi:hypothetical protein
MKKSELVEEAGKSNARTASSKCRVVQSKTNQAAKFFLMLTLIMLLSVSVFAFSACNGVLVTEGIVIAKIEVGQAGCGLEDYGFAYVPEGHYIVVSDGEYKQVFQARNEKTWNTTSLDEEWSYTALDWIIWVGES